MKDSVGVKGSVKEFNANWTQRKETLNSYWTDKPQNQIQLAFSQNWNAFREILECDGITSGLCLETGCGRGTMSLYFDDYGFDCVLVDSSLEVLKQAKKTFEKAGKKALYICGDVNNLPIKKDKFKVIFNIGLLEHFEKLDKVINEQHRVMATGGRLLAYVVPGYEIPAQKKFDFVNQFLKKSTKLFSPKDSTGQGKQDIFRSDYRKEVYLSKIKKHDVEDLFTVGLFPMPMISHSPEFPFSLMNKKAELGLTKIFETALKAREIIYRKNPWHCDSDFGQAFLLSYKKRS